MKKSLLWACSCEMVRLKHHVSLSMAAGALFVAIPYCISLAAQCMYGWPDKPGCRKYLEAIKPRRIFLLTRAVMEMLKYLQYGKLYFHLKAWYNTEDNTKHFEKGIPFGRHGNRLDLYYSPKVDEAGDFPSSVVIFVYGGAWGSGERSTYCLLAVQMAKELNATVVCPDYSTYPKGSVLDMVQDIADTLMWVKENGHKYHINMHNIVMIGHSAGAHLCALTTLFLAEGCKEVAMEEGTQYQICKALKGVIGLSGVYDIKHHYQHEKLRGVEFVSTMHRAMGGIDHFDHFSPCFLLKNLSEEALKRVPGFCLVHGTSDIIVPVESSLIFSEALTSRCVRVSLYLLPNLNHTEIVTDLMTPDRQFYRIVFGCLKQEYVKFTRSY